MSHQVATHVVEKRDGFWNVSRIEDCASGWKFIAAADGTPRYLLRMERGLMNARTVKVVPVVTEFGESRIKTGGRHSLITDELPEGGQVLLVGRSCGALTWFGGTPKYDGSSIDGGVIWKVYVSSPQRRKGIATAMLAHARDLYPDMDVRHSNALSGDGAAFAAATPTPNDLPRHPATAA